MDALTQVENALWHTCDRLLMYHSNPWELDDALKRAGFLMGPCEVQDHAGLMQVLGRGTARSAPILPRMVNEGRLGKISGVGFYRYPGGGGAVVDPLIEDLILEEAHFAKIGRKDRSDGVLVAEVVQTLRHAVDQHQPNVRDLAHRLHVDLDALGRLLA